MYKEWVEINRDNNVYTHVLPIGKEHAIIRVAIYDHDKDEWTSICTQKWHVSELSANTERKLHDIRKLYETTNNNK